MPHILCRRLKIAPPQEGKALFLYHAASYAFVNVPEISLLEWHPFTIASAPTDDDISFAIKVCSAGHHGSLVLA